MNNGVDFLEISKIPKIVNTLTKVQSYGGTSCLFPAHSFDFDPCLVLISIKLSSLSTFDVKKRSLTGMFVIEENLHQRRYSFIQYWSLVAVKSIKLLSYNPFSYHFIVADWPGSSIGVPQTKGSRIK